MRGIISCVFIISHFTSADCSEVMSKEHKKNQVKKESKLRPINLVSRCRERNPDVVASTASESPGKTRCESQIPLSSWTEQQPRTGRPVKYACSSSYSERNVDKTWSSQEWKSDELMEVKTGRLVGFEQQTDRLIVESDNTEAESEMSLKSRSFLHRVNDQVGKREDQSSKDTTQDNDKHLVTWRMFRFSALQASAFKGKNYSDNLHSIKNSGKDLTMKQMFDTSQILIAEPSDEIYVVNTINLDDFSWKHLSLVGGEKVISLSRTKVHVFSDFVFCFGKTNEDTQSNCAWERQVDVVQKFI